MLWLDSAHMGEKLGFGNRALKQQPFAQGNLTLSLIAGTLFL